MSNKLINPNNVYYVKLGRNGEWEKDCLEVSQTIRLGYREVPDKFCRQGKWDEVQEIMQGIREDVAQQHEIKIKFVFFMNQADKLYG
jgi:hypothetical protein